MRKCCGGQVMEYYIRTILHCTGISPDEWIYILVCSGPGGELSGGGGVVIRIMIQVHRRTGPVSFRGAEVSCPNILSIACPKSGFARIISETCLCPKMAI